MYIYICKLHLNYEPAWNLEFPVAGVGTDLACNFVCLDKLHASMQSTGGLWFYGPDLSLKLGSTVVF